ncbi:MAG TPA: carboxypeptidase-like regulatory domain-containing protein, partial [Candidatus Methylomirabilis sp.]|nr:carboxypeptidase-like regulatory domain-containing protein [Candidatus Methylomirabilis sp.]
MRSPMSKRRGPILLPAALALVASFFLLAAGPAHAQVGAVSGRVTDESGGPVQYATVTIQGLTVGAFTDSDGKFTLTKIPVGAYTVAVKLMGYSPTTKQVLVNAGQTTVVN